MGDVGKEIRRLREAKGWGQTKLAAAADMAVSGVSQIENGRRNPNSATLVKLARALEVEVRDLFPLEQAPLPLEQPLISQPAVQEWLRAHGHMTDEEFLDYAEELDLEIDDDGFPVGLEHAIEGLRQTCDALEAELKERPAQDALFPRRQGRFGKEGIKELFKQNTDAWKLRAKLRHEYLARELALMNYGRRLHAAGITADHLMYERHADHERRRWLEASYAEAGAA